jgi:adenylosuccinate lyase
VKVGLFSRHLVLSALGETADELDHFRDRIAADANIRKFLDEKALANTFDLKRQLRAVDAIFRRVFGAKSSAAN